VWSRRWYKTSERLTSPVLTCELKYFLPTPRNAAAASKTAGLSKAFLACSTNPQDTVSPSKLEIGGLTEEDAASTRPDLIETTSGKQINEASYFSRRAM
jgi:hypothetical protein